ncbi:hypothetical protein WJX81_001532 [Elliptochloris bilobata]|uniref:Protein kinase domain-containing protein n=1 Tax=Elliptochloris bilobata TaxID=381761 RepID=A0AAW1RBZ5_9CHLO
MVGCVVWQSSNGERKPSTRLTRQASPASWAGVHLAGLDAFREEAQMLQAMNHPHVLRFLGVCFDNEQVKLVSEYMPGGDLGSALNIEVDENGDGEKRRLGWLLEVAPYV